MKNKLIEILLAVPEIKETLHVLSNYNLPNHYLAGGAVTQCLWNKLLGNDPLYKIKDFDIVYFSHDTEHTEKDHEQEITTRLSHSIPIDVKNQANVHLWYGKRFGNDLAPLTASEDGIRMWLSAFAVGIRKDNATYKVFAPYGLEDQENMLIRPNKVAMSQDNYMTMTNSFKDRWPMINVESW